MRQASILPGRLPIYVPTSGEVWGQIMVRWLSLAAVVVVTLLLLPAGLLLILNSRPRADYELRQSIAQSNQALRKLAESNVELAQKIESRSHVAARLDPGHETEMQAAASGTIPEFACTFRPRSDADFARAEIAYNYLRLGDEQEALDAVENIENDEFRGHCLASHVVDTFIFQSVTSYRRLVDLAEEVAAGHRYQILQAAATGLRSFGEIEEARAVLEQAASVLQQFRSDTSSSPSSENLFQLPPVPVDMPPAPRDNPFPPAPPEPGGSRSQADPPRSALSHLEDLPAGGEERPSILLQGFGILLTGAWGMFLVFLTPGLESLGKFFLMWCCAKAKEPLRSKLTKSFGMTSG